MANPSSTKGKVVLVPFPFDDLSASKVRPAVCLTNPVGPHAHVIVAFITSQPPPQSLSTDLDLDPTDPDFAQTGRVAVLPQNFAVSSPRTRGGVPIEFQPLRRS
jgi:mRNA interferase MazF